MKSSFNKRKFRHGSASVIFVAIVVAMVVVLNIFADFLTDRFSLKADMTEQGIYSLSDQTKKVLGEITTDVKIYILAPQAEMETDESTRQMLETIGRFKTESGGRVDYEFVDTRKNPQFVVKYPKVRNATVRDLVVESSKRYIVLDSDNFTGTSEASKNKTFYRTEEDIAAAILYVTAEETVKAGFVTGHNEPSPEAHTEVDETGNAILVKNMLYEHFKLNNFEIDTAVDLKKGVPEGITNLVISAPRIIDFQEAEINNLEAYLSRSGASLYVFWDYRADLPVLERFLKEWGFEIESQYVTDETNSVGDSLYVYADLLETHVVDKQLQGQSVIVAPFLCPIKIVTTPDGDGTVVTAIAKTRNTSVAGDKKGPFTAIAISEHMIDSEELGATSRIVMFGTDSIADGRIAANPQAFNNTLLARTSDYLNPNTKSLQIMNKAEVSHDLAVSKGEIRAISIVLIGIVPLIFIALAVFIFIRRKNR